MRDSLTILEMLKEELSIKTDADLGRALGLKPDNIKQWRKNKSAKLEALINLAIERGIDLNRLLNDTRDYYREIGMTSEDEAFVCATATGEIFKFKESDPIDSIMPPYDTKQIVHINIPDYEIHPFDRYWIVPNNRLAPQYSEGDILIIRKKSGIIVDSTTAVWGCKIQIQNEGRIEYDEKMVLGVAYKCEKLWRGYEEHEGKIRLAATNPQFPEIIPYQILSEFEIVLHIRS